MSLSKLLVHLCNFTISLIYLLTYYYSLAIINFPLPPPVNTPPLIAGPSVLVVTLGQEAELVFSVTDDNNNLSVSLIGGLPINSTLTVSPMDGFSEVTFRWTITEIVDVSLLFEARDERNAVSVLNVQVQICACENGGDCTVEGLPSVVGSTLVLNCDCPQGREVMHVAFNDPGRTYSSCSL